MAISVSAKNAIIYRKAGLKSGEGWDDALFVPAFSIGYKAEFTDSGYSPWSERLPSVLKW